jgi:hypothetical protein
MSTDTIYPLTRGDYIIRKYDNRLARVRSIWWDDYEKEFCMNLSIVSAEGADMGRVSPACGGPTTFEPAITFRPDEYERIDIPSFPISVALKWVDGGDGKLVARDVASVKVLPFRKHKRRAKVRPKPSPAPIKGNFDPELEAASRRMAAQSLRDIARSSTPDNAEKLRAQAKVLEAEADSFAPR